MIATMRLLPTLLAAFALGALLAGRSNKDESAGKTASDLSQERAMLAEIVPEPDGHARRRRDVLPG